MSRRKRKRGGLSALGNAFSPHRGRRRKKSAWGALGSAMKPTRRKRRGRGIVGTFAAASKKRGRRRSKNAGIEGAFSNALSSNSKRGGAMARSYQKNISPRMTKTEYLEMRDSVDNAVNNDSRLSGFKRDEQITGRDSFIRRMIRTARYRFFNRVR